VFGTNAPYSTLSSERRFFEPTRNDVAHSLINEYEVDTVAHEGVTVMAGDVTKQIMLSGGELGKVAGGVFRRDFQYLEEHNRQLQRAGKPMFCLPPSVGHTALDWLLFSAVQERVGGNEVSPFSSDPLEPVATTGLLAPNDIVVKCGRTTGNSWGRVSGFVVQCWGDGMVTNEIGVIGDWVGYLGLMGDLGSAVLIEGEGGECRAGGLLVGMNKHGTFNTITPMGLLLDSMADELGGEWEWLPSV